MLDDLRHDKVVKGINLIDKLMCLLYIQFKKDNLTYDKSNKNI